MVRYLQFVLWLQQIRYNENKTYGNTDYAL